MRSFCIIDIFFKFNKHILYGLYNILFVIMGGGSSTTNKTNIATKLAVSAVANNIMNCTGNTSVTQSFKIKGDYNMFQGVKQVQNIKLSSSCAQDSKNIANLQQSVANAIKQAATSQSVSVLGALGNSDSDNDTIISNEVSQAITQNNIQNIVNNSNAQQEMIIAGNHNIVNDFSQTQTFDIVYNNAQKLINTMQSVQAIENAADQTAVSTQTNFVSDILDSVFNGLQGMGLIWLGVFAIVAFVAVKFGPEFMLGMAGKGPPPGQFKPMPPGKGQQRPMPPGQPPGQQRPMPPGQGQQRPMPPSQFKPMPNRFQPIQQRY
jgi:hypothetical protein